MQILNSVAQPTHARLLSLKNKIFLIFLLHKKMYCNIFETKQKLTLLVVFSYNDHTRNKAKKGLLAVKTKEFLYTHTSWYLVKKKCYRLCTAENTNKSIFCVVCTEKKCGLEILDQNIFMIIPVAFLFDLCTWGILLPVWAVLLYL